MEITSKFQELLGKEISFCVLKGKGLCNNAYYVETIDGGKYIIKEEREAKEFLPQNSLLVEARVAQRLYKVEFSIPVPHVIFVSESPPMYGYEYLEGRLMRDVWGGLNEEERMNICRGLGYFHAELGKKITREMAQACGVKINTSTGLHPEVVKDYEKLIADDTVPEAFRQIAAKARETFDKTHHDAVFHFIHNDSHHENILIEGGRISGIIDFGEAEYGEVAKEFSRYIRDFPDYFQYIVSAYEEQSWNQLSYERLVSNSLLFGFVDIVEKYRKGGAERVKAERTIEHYAKILN